MSSDSPSKSVQKIGELVQRFRTDLRKPLSRHTRNWMLLTAACLFVVVAAIAIGSLDELQIRPVWFVLAALPTFLLQLGNAAEYKILGAFVGQRTNWWDALEVTILASAANLLPIPGGSVVRIREIGSRSGDFQGAVRGTVVIGLFWLAAGLFVAGAGLVMLSKFLLASFAAAIGALVLGIGMITFPTGTAPASTFIRLAILEIAVCLVFSLRIALVMNGIGLDASFVTAMILAASAPIAGTLGLFPGSLGIQELLGAVLATLAVMAPQVGAASIAVDRLVGYTVLALVAGYIWITRTPWRILDDRTDSCGTDSLITNTSGSPDGK